MFLDLNKREKNPKCIYLVSPDCLHSAPPSSLVMVLERTPRMPFFDLRFGIYSGLTISISYCPDGRKKDKNAAVQNIMP